MGKWSIEQLLKVFELNKLILIRFGEGTKVGRSTILKPWGDQCIKDGKANWYFR